MSDPIDEANDLAELYLATALQNRQQKPLLPPIGMCYNCNSSIDTGFFCDKDCAEDYEHRRARQAVNT